MYKKIIVAHFTFFKNLIILVGLINLKAQHLKKYV